MLTKVGVERGTGNIFATVCALDYMDKLENWLASAQCFPAASEKGRAADGEMVVEQRALKVAERRIAHVCAHRD